MILIVLALLCTPAFGQKTAIDWVNEGHHLKAQGKYDEALQAYNKAIEIDPQEKIAWNEKANALKALGRNIEADAIGAKINELEAADTINILDHSMAGDVDESTQSVISKTHEFSVNDSMAYSWLSLGNVPEASTVWWYWFSPTGDMLHTDKVRIPLTSGAPEADDMLPTSRALWRTYNLSSHMDIAGNAAADLPGDWHVDVHLNGAKILTEYFSISQGQTLKAEEIQESNPNKSNEAIYKDLCNQGRYEISRYENINNQSKYDEAMRKGDNLVAEGRYDDAINFYDRAIDLETNDFHNYWKALNSKGGALSKQGRYAEAIQAYDKAIELIPDNPLVWASKGHALKALGRIDESNFAYATARELGDNSAGIPETNVTGLNLTSLYQVEILDHSMASNVDESTNEVITKTSKFYSTDNKIYSWLNLGHVLGATVEWHWYSPDGNPYKTDQFDIPRNPNGGYWSSYNVWDGLDIADIPAEPYLSGDWHVDIYIGNQKRLTEHFDLKIGSGRKSGPRSEPTTLGTIKVLDHGMASMIDEATDMPVKTTKTTEFDNNIMAYSWLQLGDVGVARVEWRWNHPGQDTIIESSNIPPNPSGGYWPSYNLWSALDIPNLVFLWRTGEAQAESRRSEEEREGHLSTTTNTIPDPYGDWTVDVYVNDQWLLQEQFAVVWSGLK